jgi:hypothetical protein
MYYLFGFERSIGLLQQTGFEWVLVGNVLAFWLLCYGVVALVRLRPLPQWLFLAMTRFLMYQFLSLPVNSPFYSQQRIYFNRFLLLLPSMAGCVYLLRPRFRTACREFRATIY